MMYNIISTGSKGNAVVINGNILIDAGVSYKALMNVIKSIRLVLLTHTHADHFRPSAVRQIAQKHPLIRFVCCAWMVEPLLSAGIPPQKIDVLKLGMLHKFGRDIKIAPVKLYHDVPQCGYRIFIGGEKMIYMTDTSTVEGISAKNYDLYMIEANYEEEEIQERIKSKIDAGQYAYEISAMQRHLSKEQADAFLFENMGDKSTYVYLHCHEEG